MPPLTGAGYINVADPPYNAQGNGVADDTAAFQNALNAAGAPFGSSIVFAPAGAYRIMGTLAIPASTSLVGVAPAPAYGSGPGTPQHGTVLMAFAGKGSTTGPPFIALGGDNAAVDGLTIVYPEQLMGSEPGFVAPHPFPYTIRGGSPGATSNNVAIRNTLLLNSYRGIDLGTHPCGRALVQGVHGQPLDIGIFVDQALDTVRILDVHFWPFWSHGLRPWTMLNGWSLWSRRSDWMVVQDFFSFGYAIGAFLDDPTGESGTNGQFSNLNLDDCLVGMWLNGTQPYGVQVSNLNVAGTLHGAGGAYGIFKGPRRDSRISINSASFWGSFLNPVRWDGAGMLSINQSRFLSARDFRYIHLSGAVRAMIQNNDFHEKPGGVAVACDAGGDRVVVTGNNLAGNALSLPLPPAKLVSADNLA